MLLLQKKDKNRLHTVFTVLEVHVADFVDKIENSSNTHKFRVMSHSGTLQSVEVRQRVVMSLGANPAN